MPFMTPVRDPAVSGTRQTVHAGSSVVAVTGADGFIGSHLVEALVARGYRVKAMVLYNSFGSHGWLDNLSPNVLAEVEVHIGDIRDRRSVLALMDEAATVYHLAALVAVPYSYRAPHSYVDTNITGTMNVLEAARELGTSRVVHTSTSETYGSAQSVPINEDHPLRAQSPYAATKIAADKLAESYHRSFGLPVVTLRPFNTYGPRQSTRAVIPTIITQLARGGHRVALGSLAPSRDFMWVTDTAAAFLAVGEAASAGVVGEVFNAGTGYEVTIGDLAGVISEVMDIPLNIARAEDRVRPESSEVDRLVCDARKLREATGWRPRHGLDDGLKLTVDWFTDPANLAHYDPARHI